MKITSEEYAGRKGWVLDNGVLRMTVLQGGGHIAALTMNSDTEAVNPLWQPVWKSKEPWDFKPERDAKEYDSRLLASIRGHNLCLPWFGGASEEEQRAGLGPHGEAPVVRWRLLARFSSAQRISATFGCELPASGMRFARTIEMRAGSHVIHVKERMINLTRRDIPYTYCQHVTLGPPFLEKGVTVVDMPAIEGHTYPYEFEPCPRLKMNTAFTWPDGPGKKGETVDLRMIARRYRASSDFSTQHIDPARETGWFTALHPRRKQVLAYIWRRADFPWVGSWEENYGRRRKPWAGRSLTRGMEFANTPFPCTLRDAVERGTLHGDPTFGWLPARAGRDVQYSIIWRAAPQGATGVCDIRPDGRGFKMDFVTG